MAHAPWYGCRIAWSDNYMRLSDGCLRFSHMHNDYASCGSGPTVGTQPCELLSRQRAHVHRSTRSRSSCTVDWPLCFSTPPDLSNMPISMCDVKQLTQHLKSCCSLYGWLKRVTYHLKSCWAMGSSLLYRRLSRLKRVTYHLKSCWVMQSGPICKDNLGRLKMT